MDQPTPSSSPVLPAPHKGLLIGTIVLGVVLFFSLIGNVFAFVLASTLSVENKEIVNDLVLVETARDEALDRAEDAERRLGSASARAEELATVGTYFKSKFQDLDAILLETDSNSVDFIDWMVDNATFEDLNDAEDRYATWSDIQDQTNEAYWTLSEEVTSYITALEGGDLPQGSGT